MSHDTRSHGGALSAGPFRFEFASGADPRIAEYQLRYQAFVEEHHWLAPARRGVECDCFDQFSCAALVTHIESGEAAACQRLILPDRLPPDLSTSVEAVYRPLTPDSPPDLTTLPRASWAEVSRLTIAPRFRSGRANSAIPTLAAITYASMALAIALDRYELFSISEPRTPRLLRRLRCEMRQIGEPVDFHGVRAVFRIDVRAVLHAVAPGWQPIVDQLVAVAANSIGASQGTSPSYHAA